ncbi:MAG TPA: alpha/beta hydrolase [Chloroflexota bacterium]
MTTSIDGHRLQLDPRYVELSHGRTRYIEAGDGYPTILLHGVDYTAAGDRWALTVDALSTRFRAIAPDFVGWGTGDRFDREYSFAYLTDFVREFQDALGIEKSNIVGHSMGGWIASLLAYESPERVNKLVLVASGGVSTRTLKEMTEFSPPGEDEIRAFLTSIFGPRRVDLDQFTAGDVAKMQVPGALQAYRKILRHMNDAENRKRYNTLRRLPHIKAPSLVVWGADDTVNPREFGEEIERRIPSARLEVLEGCGHFIAQQCPEQLNRLLLEFL